MTFISTPSTGARSKHRAATRAANRAATRTAILTVALPSAATLGVFAAAVAAVHGGGTVHQPVRPRPAPAHPHPSPSADKPPVAQSTADRAARGQAREDLAQRQDEAQRAQEPARPRFVLPVAQRGLSAAFGQAGTHWSARHTGIDFPVDAGTPVMAATDGTVATQWSSAYGYLAIVTAPDGTQTWYGHLRSYRIRRGPVRAGDVIAYSGSSGNSTGPHLHFEVRPNGGTPVDPVPWLLSHGLDPC